MRVEPPWVGSVPCNRDLSAPPPFHHVRTVDSWPQICLSLDLGPLASRAGRKGPPVRGDWGLNALTDWITWCTWWFVSTNSPKTEPHFGWRERNESHWKKIQNKTKNGKKTSPKCKFLGTRAARSFLCHSSHKRITSRNRKSTRCVICKLLLILPNSNMDAYLILTSLKFWKLRGLLE